MPETEIRFKSANLELAGTLAVPDAGGPFPVVLLIPGSGQTDRNENTPKFRINAFYEISHDLARNGIASFRYDKRGVGQSQGDHLSAGFYDHVEDAAVALRMLLQRPDIRPNQVFVLGHSEGAFIAVRLAGTGAPAAGIILVSGAAYSGEAVLKWQAVKIAAGLKGFNAFLLKLLRINVLKAQQKQIDKIKSSKKDWYRQNLFAKINAKWLREFMAYDPALDLPKVGVPVLAVTGSKDIQVDPADLKLMAELLKGDFESHEVPNMTHLLRVEEGEATISNYKQQIKKPLDPRLLPLITAWREKHISN